MRQDSLSVLQEADVRLSEVLLNMIIHVLKQVMDSVPEKKRLPAVGVDQKDPFAQRKQLQRV